MTDTTTADNEPGRPLGLPLNDGLGAWVPVAERMPPPGSVVLVAYRNQLGHWRRIRAEWVPAKTQEADIDNEFGEYDEATDIAALRGQAVVLRRLLADALAVLRTIDPDDTDEAERLESLCAAVALALQPKREGTLL